LTFFYFILNHFSSVGRFLLVCFPTSLALALALDGDNPLRSSDRQDRAQTSAPPERLFSGLALAAVLLFFSRAYYLLAVMFFKARWVA
jgi:hypothetical protein